MLKEMAMEYITASNEIEYLEQKKLDLDAEAREKFGSYAWLDAINRCPIVIEDSGEIAVRSGANIWDVAECLRDLAVAHDTELVCQFNGTDLKAHPSLSVREMLTSWDRSRY